MADLLSKITIGGVTYDLKDASARSNFATLLGEHALTALGNAAWGTITSNASLQNQGTALPTEGAVKDYVDAAVASIPDFDVVIDSADPSTGEPATQASEETFHKIYLVPATGSAGAYAEYITIRSGEAGSYSYAWEKIGTTEVDLADYVKKTTTIAGVDLQDNITQGELQVALNLGSMAYTNTASGTVNGVTINGQTATGTPEGTITVNDFVQTSTAADLTTADYTPAGNVSVVLNNTAVLSGVATAGTLPSMGEDVFVKPTFVEGNFSAGSLPSKAADTFTQGTLPSKEADTFDAGTLPSLGTATTSVFATEGIVATANAETETLTFTAAGNASAVTAQGTFSAGSLPSFTEGSFSQGTLPTFVEGAFSAGTLPSKEADTFTQGSFTQGEFTPGAMPTFTNATVGVQSATFSGTTQEDILVTGVSYDKATANGATFAGNAATFNVSSYTIDNQTVTVSPVND